jgi:aminoglycoside N3'-acetyltransferase
MSLAEERQILKEMHGIQKSKTQVDEYHSMEKQVQDTKVRGSKSANMYQAYRCQVSHMRHV